MALKILVADDHAFTLAGMQHALAQVPGLEICATARGGIEAVALAKVHRPDLAVLDFAMPDATGLEVVSEIRRWSPGTRCLIVTGSTDPQVFVAMTRSGVDGLFTKSCRIDELAPALQRVARGETVISDRVARILRSVADQPDLSLSDRERQVLVLIARGLTNTRIGTELSISPKTVESHRASLMRKLDVNSVAALVVEAIRRGLFLP